MSNRVRWATAVAAFALLVALTVAVAVGPLSLPFGGVIGTLFGNQHALSPLEQTVLLQIRLPRVLLAGLVGAALAGSGSVYQTVFRNPLADPYLLG
ncbi:MAG: hypothetical protein RJA35_83, partial [Actinomycetota bacterium]